MWNEVSHNIIIHITIYTYIYMFTSKNRARHIARNAQNSRSLSFNIESRGLKYSGPVHTCKMIKLSDKDHTHSHAQSGKYLTKTMEWKYLHYLYRCEKSVVWYMNALSPKTKSPCPINRIAQLDQVKMYLISRWAVNGLVNSYGADISRDIQH